MLTRHAENASGTLILKDRGERGREGERQREREREGL